MTLTTLLLILLLFAVTLLSGVGALVLLRHHPAWSVPVTGALTVMMLMATVTGLLVAVTRS
ncbi:hypothetical protein JK361_39565 [Streptomyces sp. 5-8]|uniref:NADH-quinone oxidoreductase subunit J n=1 Tax=Streptomyces musisoli TaxID=2802280 RepID=A0ABS1PFG0_9ACTN|nr:hypothetical protein [Streptomyces musisoli]MBL1110576.1 hypothetical protein [Streptomyces musisoli]